MGGDVFYLDILIGRVESFDEEGSDIPTLRAVMEAHDPAWQRLVAGDIDPTTVVAEYEDSGYETHASLGVRLAQALYHGTDHRRTVTMTAEDISTPLIVPLIRPAGSPSRCRQWATARPDGTAVRLR